MKRTTSGGTLLYKIQLISPVTGAALQLDGLDLSAVVLASADVTPAVPTISRVDENTINVRVDTTGLGGHSCRARVTASDPITDNVYAVDVPFLVEV